MDLAITLVGWLGAFALLAAYAAVSTGRLAGRSPRFQVVNLAGAAALTLNSGYHEAWPSVGLNLVWIAIGLAAIRHWGENAGP